MVLRSSTRAKLALTRSEEEIESWLWDVAAAERVIVRNWSNRSRIRGTLIACVSVSVCGGLFLLAGDCKRCGMKKKEQNLTVHW